MSALWDEGQGCVGVPLAALALAFTAGEGLPPRVLTRGAAQVLGQGDEGRDR
jgi:hypothetical protein